MKHGVTTKMTYSKFKLPLDIIFITLALDITSSVVKINVPKTNDLIEQIVALFNDLVIPLIFKKKRIFIRRLNIIN